MRRGEEPGPQAVGVADPGAHRRRAALAVRAGHHHRMSLKPRAIDSRASPAIRPGVRGRRRRRISAGRTPEQSHRGERVMPDFQDQIAAIGLLQQPDRRIGVDFDHRYGAGLATDPTNRSTAATRSPSARVAPSPVHRRSEGGDSNTIVPPALRFIRPGIFPPFAFRRHGVERGIVHRRRSWRQAAARSTSLWAASNSRKVCTPSPITNGGALRAQYSASSSSRKIRYSMPSMIGCTKTAS